MCGEILDTCQILIPKKYIEIVSSIDLLYSGHPWDRKVSLIERSPHFRGQNVHNTNVWDSTSYSD